MTTYWSSAPGSATRPACVDGVLVDGRRTAGSPGSTDRRAPPAARTPGRPDVPGPGELPQPRVPPGPARAHPARARDVLDLARADVRRRRDADPGQLLRAGPGDVPGDGLGRDHLGRRVPLPAPRARRHAVRRPERDGEALVEAARRGRDPDRPAGHVLPHRRHRPPRPRASSSASPTATRTPGPHRVSEPSLEPPRRLAATDVVVGAARSTRSAPCPATRCPPSRPGPTAAGAAARAPVRAGRRERRLPGGVRRDAHRAARRSRRAGTAHHRRARHPPERLDVAAARRLRAPAPASAPRPSATSATASARPRRLLEAGAPLTLGSDSHAVIDLFEEMRAVELDERLATRERGHWSADELLRAATYDGHASLGFDGAGRIEVGAAGRPGHARHDGRAHRGHRRRRGHGRVRGVRRRRGPGAARRGRHHPRPGATSAPSSTG